MTLRSLVPALLCSILAACGGSHRAPPTDDPMTMSGPEVCTPACTGKACGPDGCGGVCGTCKAPATCDNGGACVSECVPSCGDRVCGDDGCGGACGTCATGSCAADGVCRCTSDAQCGADFVCGTFAGKKECSPICDVFAPTTGCGSGTACTGVAQDDTGRTFAICITSGDKTESETCTHSATGDDCSPGLGCVGTGSSTATSCASYCDTSHACKPGQTCSPLFIANKQIPFSTCNPPEGACMPNPCTGAHQTVCTATGGTATCGCDAGFALSGGACQCVPKCSGKVCGPDGCGGTCGSCGAGTSCTAAGTCACAPQCSGKTCGPNGCGGTCGTCSFGTCNAGGTCSCTPSCTGKTCGPDGCGGSCGTCNGTCSSGVCTVNPDLCDPVANTGCTLTNECILLSDETTRCALLGTGTRGSSCSSTKLCDGGFGCFAGTCRKICERATEDGCFSSETCTGVTGWTTYGACQ